MKDAEISRVPCLFCCVNCLIKLNHVLYRVARGVDFNVVFHCKDFDPHGLHRGDFSVHVLGVGHLWCVDGSR
jgi:hypothetical protein